MENMMIRKEGQALQQAQLQESWIDEFCLFLDRSKKTTESYTKNLRSFYTWMRMKEITAPVRNDILEYRSWLQSAHFAIKLDPATITGWNYQLDREGRRIRIACKPATVAAYIRSVKAFYSWLEIEKGILNITKQIQTPAVKYEEGHVRTGLEDEEIRHLIHSIESNQGSTQQEKEQRARIKALVLLAVTAGLRTIELSRATIGDLEERNGRAWLYIWGKGRTGATQRKALAQGTYEAIKEYLALRTDPMRSDSPLFRATGNRSDGGAVLPTTISTWIKRELQAAGFNSDKLTAHSLRHTAAHQALNVSNRNIYTTQLYMRHLNPATTEIYLREEKLKDEAGLADLIFSQVTSGSNQAV